MSFLYQIILVGQLFSNHSIVVADQFITREACTAVAARMSQQTRRNYQCVPVPAHSKI